MSLETTTRKSDLTLLDVENIWNILSPDEKIEALFSLPRYDAEDFFFRLQPFEQAQILKLLPHSEQRSWVRLLAPDEVTDVLQSLDDASTQADFIAQLDTATAREVRALLAYAEDDAGGLMNSKFARLRPDMTIDEAITYLKNQTRRQTGGVYYIYVMDEAQRLMGVVSYRDLFASNPTKYIRDIMKSDVVKVEDTMDQEAVAKVIAKYNLLAVPVVDSEGRIKGIVTVDDVVDVITEEATEDIQNIGGLEALELPYMTTSFSEMMKKRAGWLAILFLGEMLTATAMGFFADEIEKTVLLALFVPLIISSGGNSGSQASTLVIRAMALGELSIRDWYRVVKRELFSGVVLGTVLGVIGYVRILLWEIAFHSYGQHYMLIALTVFISLVGVVTFGTLAGSMLPFLLRRLGFDPASASAPFVATLVDVSGLVIYFTVAAIVLSGTLL